MREFIPSGWLLLTTEEEMLPILAEGADKVGTRLRAVGWKQAGLIHKSLLARFPYEEHPYNIALVTALGDELGLDHDFCVREMADRVVADLGVLKTYPRSAVNGCTLEYVMGNSANERSEEHTSELQSLMRNSYAVFCLKKKKKANNKYTTEYYKDN